MIIVLFIIFAIGIIISLIGGHFYNDNMGYIGVFGLGFLEVIVIGCGITLIDDVVNSKYIDKKIAMYQQENTQIEEQMTTIVNNYKEYEKETIKNISDMEVIFIKFPELKTSELVKEQIKVYQENNKKIKELKEQQIEYESSKWWLYFGGSNE